MDDAAPARRPYAARFVSPPDARTTLLPATRGADRVLDVVLVVLVVGSAVRYLSVHGPAPGALAALPAAALLVAGWLVRHQLPDRAAVYWLAGVSACWLLLVLAAPSFGWCAVPLAFAALRVLPFLAATVLIAGMVAAVTLTWWGASDRFDPTLLLGPACLAVLAIGAYRALASESARRQRLLDELTSTRDELAAAQRAAGAMAERHRLSRELHDTLAQDLTSINLLLRAAEQDRGDPPVGAELVARAAATARSGLAEVRRVVRDLAPSALAEANLSEALERACAQAGAAHPIRLRVVGQARPLSSTVEAAVLRTARGALANVVEHAAASTAVVTLTYLDDAVALDVRDDGRGLAPAVPAAAVGGFSAAAAGAGPVTAAGAGDVPGAGARGHGLRGIRERVEALHGTMVTESAPGEGTALAITIPVR